MAWEEQQSTARDEVEHCDILFFACKNVFTVQKHKKCRSTKNEAYLVYIIQKPAKTFYRSMLRHRMTLSVHVYYYDAQLSTKAVLYKESSRVQYNETNQV